MTPIELRQRAERISLWAFMEYLPSTSSSVEDAVGNLSVRITCLALEYSRCVLEDLKLKLKLNKQEDSLEK